MNRLQYIAATLFPLGLIFIIRNNLYFFVVGLLFFALIYKPLIDYSRLKSLGLVDKRDFGKFFLPFWSIRLRWKCFILD